MSQRNARFNGFFLILFIKSFFPAIIPHCGPPTNLSPLNVTMSAPSSKVSLGDLYLGNPIEVSSIKDPLPRSTINGIPFLFDNFTISFSLTSDV